MFAHTLAQALAQQLRTVLPATAAVDKRAHKTLQTILVNDVRADKDVHKHDKIWVRNRVLTGSRY